MEEKEIRQEASWVSLQAALSNLGSGEYKEFFRLASAAMELDDSLPKEEDADDGHI